MLNYNNQYQDSFSTALPHIIHVDLNSCCALALTLMRHTAFSSSLVGKAGRTVLHDFSIASQDGTIYFYLTLNSQNLNWTVNETFERQ